jgi:hypothetical protein
MRIGWDGTFDNDSAVLVKRCKGDPHGNQKRAVWNCRGVAHEDEIGDGD